MNYLELRAHLKEFTVFSLSDIRKIEPGFHRARLVEWQAKGYIKKILRGYYMFTDTELSEPLLFEIANKIYKPSYVSFETALSYYNLIPESVYAITSASTRKTCKFKNPLEEFIYTSLKPALFFGFDIVSHNTKPFKIACAEKAVLDYFYIKSFIKTHGDFESLRINKDIFFQKINREKLGLFLERVNNKSLTKRLTAFLEFIKNA